jgi:diguanylate cyclase (GGDEF)-like protein
MPLVSLELGQVLLQDQADLRREVLLWQRWVRLMALAALLVLSVIFGSAISEAIVPTIVLSIAYIACVLGTTWMLQRSRAEWQAQWFPALMMTADIVTLAGFCYLTSPPFQANRVLMLGFLSVQLGVFYFGRRQGILGAALSILAYLLFALIAPPFIPGPRPTVPAVAFNATLFALITGALIYTFGSFRERMDALRMYCKVVESGEIAQLPRVGEERWPDDLTLLARSFDAMRIRLAEQIGTDPLTGCFNRRSLESRLRSDLRHARRRGTTVAVAAIDLDHFKEINDSKGHPVGDLVLQQLAGIMKGTARDTDAVARFGGDEFVIVLPDTGWQGALTFAERLRRRVDDYTFGTPATPMSLTISIGVALGRGTETSSEKLLQDADNALYKAKAGGRNRVFS